MNFQLNVFCALDLIENVLQKKLSPESDSKSIISYLGCLQTIYLIENDYDVYAYAAMNGFKIIVIIK